MCDTLGSGRGGWGGGGGVVVFQAEDGIRDLVRSRGLGDVYKRQQSARYCSACCNVASDWSERPSRSCVSARVSQKMMRDRRLS